MACGPFLQRVDSVRYAIPLSHCLYQMSCFSFFASQPFGCDHACYACAELEVHHNEEGWTLQPNISVPLTSVK